MLCRGRALHGGSHGLVFHVVCGGHRAADADRGWLDAGISAGCGSVLHGVHRGGAGQSFGGQGWAGRCIKAVAGLYILAVLLAQLPHLQMGRVAAAFSGNTAPAALSAIQSDALETEILTETKAQLEEYCTAQCRQQFGLDIRVTVTLEKAGQQVVVKRLLPFPAGCTAAQKQAALSIFAADAGAWHRQRRRAHHEKERIAFRFSLSVKKQQRAALRWRWLSVCWQCCCFCCRNFYPVAIRRKRRHPPPKQPLSASIRPSWSSSWKGLSVNCRGGAHHGHGHPDHRRGDYLCSRYPDRRSATAGEARSLQDGSALAETTYLPQVCGVAVLCEGGGDVRVAARITELLHSLLDLPTNRICVEQRKR